GAVDRGRGLGPQQNDGARVPETPQRFCSHRAPGPRAHDHDTPGRRRSRCVGTLQLLAHADAVAAFDDAVAGNGLERRRRRLTGTELETRVMPGTADGAVSDDAFTERPTVVGAHAAHGKQLAVAPRQHDWLAVSMTEQQTSVRDIAGGNA